VTSNPASVFVHWVVVFKEKMLAVILTHSEVVQTIFRSYVGFWALSCCIGLFYEGTNERILKFVFCVKTVT
jgi:hypothetical protein